MSRYLDVEMPDVFVLEAESEKGEWIDHGLLRAADCGRLEDGTYVWSSGSGSPVFLRCVEQRGPILHVVDGSGAVLTYRLRALT